MYDDSYDDLDDNSDDDSDDDSDDVLPSVCRESEPSSSPTLFHQCTVLKCHHIHYGSDGAAGALSQSTQLQAGTLAYNQKKVGPLLELGV